MFINPSDIQLNESWKTVLLPEFQSNYMAKLKHTLVLEKKHHTVIYPVGKDVFKALNLTNFHHIRVVILGQDPYPGTNQANGLAFSVNKGIPFPKSLQNIFTELHNDLQIQKPTSGDLTPWAQQNILLLNTVLTVRAHHIGSHRGIGWEPFTTAIITYINDLLDHVVFILWGADARAKKPYIDQQKHYIIESAHPSPLSAHRGFFSSKPFSKTNKYLETNHYTPIQWDLP